MAQLVALVAEGSGRFVAELQRLWDAGDAVLPLDPRLPPPAREALLDELRPAAVVDPSTGERSRRGGAAPVEAGDALVVPTSGTAGAPKGVVLTHEAVAASAEATSRRLEIDPGRDHWLACLPLAHVGGLSVVTRALATSTPLTVIPRPDPEAVQAAAAGGATLVSLVATALRRIETSRFRAVLLGGSRPPDERPANVVVTYGMTETGSGVVYDGRPLDGVEVREAGGELWVRGPMLLRCYRDGRDPKDAGGWLATGDAGSVRPDGRVEVHGRMADVIVTGAEKVWPGPVEEILQTVAGVADAAVAGRPDPEWGERVVAWVVPRDPADPPSLEGLRAAVKERLPAYAAPRELVIVDDLPRTGLGKVRRTDLA